jgi:hypothetical protein
MRVSSRHLPELRNRNTLLRVAAEPSENCMPVLRESGCGSSVARTFCHARESEERPGFAPRIVDAPGDIEREV